MAGHQSFREMIHAVLPASSLVKPFKRAVGLVVLGPWSPHNGSVHCKLPIRRSPSDRTMWSVVAEGVQVGQSDRTCRQRFVGYPFLHKAVSLSDSRIPKCSQGWNSQVWLPVWCIVYCICVASTIRNDACYTSCKDTFDSSLISKCTNSRLAP